MKKLLSDRKFWFLVFSLLCFIAAGVCLIVDWALNDGLTWAVYPLLSIVFFWLVMVPFFWLKYSLLGQLVVLSVLILPYLYFLDLSLPGADWFLAVALPTGLLSIVAVWLTYLIVRFTKINLWYRLSIASFLLLVLVNPLIKLYFNSDDSGTLDTITNVFGGIVATGFFLILGYASSAKKVDQKPAKTVKKTKK